MNDQAVVILLVCDWQALACAWLGHWYKEIGQNYFKARNCYRRALVLDPTDTVVGARHFLFPPHKFSHIYGRLVMIVCQCTWHACRSFHTF